MCGTEFGAFCRVVMWLAGAVEDGGEDRPLGIGRPLSRPCVQKPARASWVFEALGWRNVCVGVAGVNGTADGVKSPARAGSARAARSMGQYSPRATARVACIAACAATSGHSAGRWRETLSVARAVVCIACFARRGWSPGGRGASAREVENRNEAGA